MKIRRLPDTDLAKIAPLSAADKRRALEQFHLGWAPFSYEPTRSMTPDLLNARMGLFDDLPETDWSAIEPLIKRRLAGNERGLAANLEVARLLYDWARALRIDAIHREFGVFGAQAVRYWSNMLIVWDGRPTILFADYRRNPLVGAGMTFAASVMNDRVRSLNPDLQEARLGFIQFPEVDAKKRGIRLVIADEHHLHDHDELVRMVDETYALWGEISATRTEDARRRGSGGGS